MNMRTTFDLRLISERALTPRVKQFEFERTDQAPFNFIAGQFVTFLFEDTEGKLCRRSYSLANAPGEKKLEIAVAPVQGGFATEIFWHLKIGDVLPCSGPFGRLILPDFLPPHLILVATGTGVSPYRAMLPALAEALQTQPESRVSLLLGVQHEADLLYAEDFLAFAAAHSSFNFFAYLSREKDLTAPYQRSGYVQTAFSELSLNPEQDLVYLCGNPNMIDNSFAWLQEKGFSSQRVRREKYI